MIMYWHSTLTINNTLILLFEASVFYGFIIFKMEPLTFILVDLERTRNDIPNQSAYIEIFSGSQCQL